MGGLEGAEGLQRRREDIRHTGIQLGVPGTKMGSGAKSELLASASLLSNPLAENPKCKRVVMIVQGPQDSYRVQMAGINPHLQSKGLGLGRGPSTVNPDLTSTSMLVLGWMDGPCHLCHS